MGWRETLNGRPASYRGASFFVGSAESAFGRRTADHEFPGQDKPFIEDLGRRARQFVVRGYVIGVNYLLSKDALTAQCEKPGIGLLVHPYQGLLQVSCQRLRWRDSVREGGMARCEITFIETGELVFPRTVLDTRGLVETRKISALQALSDGFQRAYSIANEPLSVLDSVSRTIDSAFAAIGTARKIVGTVASFQRGLADAVNSVARLVTDPLALVTDTLELLSFGTFVDSLDFNLNAANARAQFNEMKELFNQPADDATIEQSVVYAKLVQEASIVVAGGLTGVMEYESKNDALEIRGVYLEKLEELLFIETDEEVYTALVDERTAIATDIDIRAADLSQLTEYTTPEPLPALVIAHELYGSVAQEFDIVERNRIKHPGFVSGGGNPIEVLLNA